MTQYAPTHHLDLHTLTFPPHCVSGTLFPVLALNMNYEVENVQLLLYSGILDCTAPQVENHLVEFGAKASIYCCDIRDFIVIIRQQQSLLRRLSAQDFDRFKNTLSEYQKLI